MTSSGWPVTRTRPPTMLWSRLVARPAHFSAAAFPAVAILWMLDVHDVGVVRAYPTLSLLAGVLTVSVFTAFGVCGREHFSSRSMFRRLWFSWSAALGLVWVLHSLYAALQGRAGDQRAAQVHGCRGETDTVEKIQKRVEHDLAYIEHWSVWLDLYILACTVPAVLSMQGAY